MHVGSHSCYTHGCREPACREAHREYERDAKRRRNRPGGTRQALCDPSEAQRHLLWLQGQGVGLRRLSAHTGVSLAALDNIRRGRSTRITERVESKILACGKHLFTKRKAYSA